MSDNNNDIPFWWDDSISEKRKLLSSIQKTKDDLSKQIQRLYNECDRLSQNARMLESEIREYDNKKANDSKKNREQKAKERFNKDTLKVGIWVRVVGSRSPKPWKKILELKENTFIGISPAGYSSETSYTKIRETTTNEIMESIYYK